MKTLQRHVVPRVASDWYQLGLELLDEAKVTELDNIESDDSDCKRCCFKMLKYWIRTHPNATWNHLVEALESPGVELFSVAAEVKKMFAG